MSVESCPQIIKYWDNTESAKLQEMYCVAFQHKQVVYGTIQGGFLQCKQELSGAGRRLEGVICHKNDWSQKNVLITISPWVLFNIYPSLGATREEDEQVVCLFTQTNCGQSGFIALCCYNKDDIRRRSTKSVGYKNYKKTPSPITEIDAS